MKKKYVVLKNNEVFMRSPRGGLLKPVQKGCHIRLDENEISVKIHVLKGDIEEVKED